MALTSVRDIAVRAHGGGQEVFTSFRKVPVMGSVQGNWVDLSMAPGNPRPNYYTGDERTATLIAVTRGLPCGGNVSPSKKFLRSIGLGATNAGFAPSTVMLCDWLMFYPLIDMDNDAPQALVNTADDPLVPSLPRYTDGLGVKAFLVASNPYVGGQPFNITYTNELGVQGRTSAAMGTNASTFIATIVNAGLTAGVRGPFIDLAPGDQGIRSVQSIQFAGANGGLAVLVLVKPLATVQVREVAAWAEFDFLRMKDGMPQVLDGAVVNMLCMCNATVAAQYLTGYMTTIWG